MKRGLTTILSTIALSAGIACDPPMPPTGKVVDQVAQAEEQSAYSYSGTVQAIAYSSGSHGNAGIPFAAYTLVLSDGTCGRRLDHLHEAGEKVTIEQVELEAAVLEIAKSTRRNVTLIGSAKYPSTGCVAIETITIDGKEYSHTR